MKDQKPNRAAVIRRAVQAWTAGKPYQAYEILTTAGYGDQWPVFRQVALRHARARYGRRIRAYTAR